MPALSRVRVSALAELAEGQRFTPARTVVRQIERIERLALEIEPDRAYDEAWIVHRITGFRTRVEEPRQIVGAALLADLSALAERLSETAVLPDAPDAGMGIDQLASMWNVSRKTIERYRRTGLIGRRVRGTGGRVRIVFSPEAVRAFAQTRGPRIARAAGFTRMSHAERAQAARWARGYRARLGWSVSQAAARIAVRLGRSPGAVREALAGAGDASLEVRKPSTDRDARLAERALQFGVPAERIAERLGRSRATVHRLAIEARVRRLRGLNLATPVDDRLDDAGAERALSSAHVQSGLATPAWNAVGDALAWSEGVGPVDAAVERARAGAYHALRWLVARDLRAERRASADLVERCESRLRWASALKRWLVAHELPLVARTVSVTMGMSVEAMPPDRAVSVLRSGLAVVGAALDGFDHSRGGRLAAAASLPLARWMGSVANTEAPSRAGGARRTRARAVMRGWDAGLTPWESWVRPPESVGTHWVALPEPGRSMVCLRFGLDGSRPRTLAEVAALTGASQRSVALTIADAGRACRRISADRDD